jgi:CheY-like chemotaxis protein
MTELQTRSMRHRPTVLVVDDDRFSRTMAASRLATLDAHLVEAENGDDAMAMIRHLNIDLAIVDLEMPGSDGFALLSCIRGHPRLKHIPVVVLTGREDREAMSQALAAGATSFLQKPLNWTAFGEHIRHLIELSSGLTLKIKSLRTIRA